MTRTLPILFSVTLCSILSLGSGQWLFAAPTSTSRPTTATARPATSRPAIAHKQSPPPLHGEIIKRGRINCFPKGLRRGKKGQKLAYCETSAVAWDGRHLILGSDKRMRGKYSAVFSLPHKREQHQLSRQQVKYQTHPLWQGTKKFEDFAVDPSRQFGFATTGFDRVRIDGQWDKYNRLLYWPIESPQQSRLFKAAQRHNVSKQIPLRRCLANALSNREYPQGVPYFKVEGLAVTPTGQLLFGIREQGASYKAFRYTVKIVAVSYRQQGDKLHILEDCHLLYDFSARAHQIVGKPVGLSSLHFDGSSMSIYLLTSFETSPTAAGLGGYLWRIPFSGLFRNEPAQLVRDPKGRPLLFAHKPEAMTLLDPHTMLVIHDDDRVVGSQPVKTPRTHFYRQPHQAAYSIVKIHP